MCQIACHASQNTMWELCLGLNCPNEIEGMWKNNLNFSRCVSACNLSPSTKQWWRQVTSRAAVCCESDASCFITAHITGLVPEQACHSMNWDHSSCLSAECACVFGIVYLSVLLGVCTSGFWGHVSAEWQVEALRGVRWDGQSSYLWFKDWHGSEPGRRGGFCSGEGGGGGLLCRWLCTSCVTRFVIPSHLFCMRTCLYHESSTKGIIYHAKTKGVCY